MKRLVVNDFVFSHIVCAVSNISNVARKSRFLPLLSQIRRFSFLNQSEQVAFILLTFIRNRLTMKSSEGELNVFCVDKMASYPAAPIWFKKAKTAAAWQTFVPHSNLSVNSLVFFQLSDTTFAIAVFESTVS